ncbi:MAG: 6-pyruvoyl tetrahydrobiopterin synthase [Acidobacteria bacterium 13_1_40CM_4_69_4]|nr:MAG: 6-pyruvoyl tetrahydrobiopterin synthase [Acidobacteria bacterium 13_1_40CM_4_69_4]
MYTVTEIVEFCYGHRLLRYKGKCAHLHGHNGRVEIELASPSLNDQSMVADFSDIGRIVKEWIDQNLDHRMLLHTDDPLVAVLRRHDEPVFVMSSDPTAEAIARLIYEYASSQGLKVSGVRLWETGGSVASYSPHPAR